MQINRTIPRQLEHASCQKEASFKDVLAGVYDLPENEAEEKFDGLRYFAQIRPYNLPISYLTSRRISTITGRYVEKQDKVPTFRDFKFPKELHDSVFDGEFTSEGISSDTQHAMAQGRGLFRTWDIVFYKGLDMRQLPRTERKEHLLGLLSKYRDTFEQVMNLVPALPKPSELLQRVIARGGEGIIIKNRFAPYGEGWTKVKGAITADCVITGFEMSTEGKYFKNKWIGSVMFSQWIPLNRVTEGVTKKEKWALRLAKLPTPRTVSRKNVTYILAPMGKTSGMKEKQRAEFTANPKKYIGQAFEVEAHLRLPSGLFRSPRFNRFRHDKNPEDCIWNP